ncbi:MAG: zf-HC2 domain-containing protein [Acidobacteriota bacterium]|nr:zf-HC2 domain-containing protein [Acidobacteriota bacterium]
MTTILTCPSDEDLAAYLDGTLEPEARARVTEHLADCESCFQIFAGAARVRLDLEDEAALAGRERVREDEPAVAPPLPFPTPSTAGQRDDGLPAYSQAPPGVHPSRGSRRARGRARLLFQGLAAAALLAAVAIPVYKLLFPPLDLTAARLASSLPKHVTNADSVLWTGAVKRGAAMPQDTSEEADELKGSDRAFRIGVQLVDLDWTLGTDSKSAAGACQRLCALFGQMDLEDKRERPYCSLRIKIDGGQNPRSFLLEARQLEARVAQALEQESRHLDFGRWAEAGRLAAHFSDSQFLTRRDTRRFLHALIEWRPKPDDNQEEDPIAQTVQLHLQDLERALDGPPLDYQKIESLYTEIIRFYYPSR